MAGPRKFDHDEARARHAAGESIYALARAYGVGWNAVARCVSLANRERQNAYHRGYQRRRRVGPCRNGCGRESWDDRLCSVCAAEAQRTAPHGTETRYSSGCHCDDCREAARVAKAARRERRKVACTSCGKPRLHPNDAGAKSRGITDTGLCLDCYRASIRKAA